MMNISMVNAFVSLKTAGDDDQFKKELQYIMNYRVAAWLLHNACWMSFPIITRFRDVTEGATGATEVAPKFSDIFTLLEGGRFCSTSQS